MHKLTRCADNCHSISNYSAGNNKNKLMALTETQKKSIQVNVPFLVAALLNNNVNPVIIPYIIAQMILETGYFTNTSFIKDRNPGGITWNQNYLKRLGTSKGSARPLKEGGVYVHFDNFDTAIKDYLRIINKSPGLPVSATSPADFAHRLKINNYYKAAESDYVNTINSVYNRINENVNIAALLKKKSSLNMAGLPLIFAGLFLGTLFFNKK